MTAISTLVKLQQQGHNVTMEDLLQSRGDTNLENTVKQISDELHYIRRDVKFIPAEEAQRLVAECFAKKSPMVQCDPSVTSSDIMFLLRQNWLKALDHSFGVVDEKGKFRGVALACDGTELELHLQGVHPHLVTNSKYLDAITAQAAPHFTADPRVPGISATFKMSCVRLRSNPHVASTNDATGNIIALHH